MTYITKSRFPADLMPAARSINDALSPFSIGLFDTLLETLNNETAQFAKPIGYPPYNIHKKDDVYTIELAVAGFKQEDISIEYFDKTLTIKGTSPTKIEDGTEVIYAGIANRAFTRTFTLADTVEVVGADLKDGMLTVTCKQWIPERLQKKTITINNKTNEGLDTGGDSREPVLLNESK